ncbi:DNA/RNA non-specific endonuclease [Agromyces sp. H3Y2-19a]|jgi:endonuclease G|uniref:DNA/RNA non-specific endonuclease n=1 Tax=Agromyces TaxID=33877 RepID=UPI001E36487B|nr:MULTISPECIES: DNA/RNA non-specific endonuclease [Agromyces]MCD5345360.1 DNA/RNA non-specific endonuclease [Agromyces sp. S2-1-8]MDF0513481.1 DNA/RNA non-specific endonuclease [Agromyces chromiiresistens]
MGFDATFLGVAAPMPRVAGPGAPECVELDYVHFAVVLDPARRLARVTGVNVDGAALVDLDRGGDEWRLDDRVPADWQAGPVVYADNDFDRGHLVRRRDPVWGERAVAARANADTFHYTNAAPQASGFNQSKELWLGLEDHVLAYAEATAQRLSVFTAPVLAAGDPEYRGIRVPLRFWKVVAWNARGALAATAFIVDQAPLVDTSEARPVVGGAPPLGPFRTFQVPVADVAELTGLEMPELIAADVLPPTAIAAGWRRIESFDEVLLHASSVE